jgi:hypothetical protein
LEEEELQRVKSGSKSGFSDGSSDMSGSQGKRGKITPTSEVRYYGRGKSCKCVELFSTAVSSRKSHLDGF